MTRIRFIITSGSSIVLGSNIEPLASISDILRTVNYRIYEQCTPYISLDILLRLRMCIPINEITLWTNVISNAVAVATGMSHVCLHSSVHCLWLAFRTNQCDRHAQRCSAQHHIDRVCHSILPSIRHHPSVFFQTTRKYRLLSDHYQWHDIQPNSLDESINQSVALSHHRPSEQSIVVFKRNSNNSTTE